MILGQCIAAGYPELMRASRAMRKDGRAVIFKEGVYRMRFGDEETERNAQRPDYEDTQLIENVDVMVDTTTTRGDGVVRAVGYWIFQMRPRMQHHGGKRCEAVFKVDCALTTKSDLAMRNLLECFCGFEKVVVRVEVRPCPCIVIKNGAFGGYFRSIFGEVLGKADLVKVEGGYCYTFWPRRYVKGS